MENGLDRPLKKHWRHRWDDKEWQHGYQRVLIDLEQSPVCSSCLHLERMNILLYSSRFPATKEARF